MDVILFFGDARSGKSQKARRYAKLYGKHFRLGVPNGDTVWFNGYNGQNTLIIDEFKGWMKPTFLNDILDIYPVDLPTKFGFVKAKYTHVFITSNYPPEEWWGENVKWNKEALYGRINHIYQFTGNNYLTSTVKKLK